MKINKIQILIPGGGFYGGIESLHQLADKLHELNYNVKVIYIPLKKIFFNTNFKLNKNLKNYKISLDTKIEDRKNNLIIVPETFTGYLKNIINAKKMIYWLSIDNYFTKISEERKFFFKFLNFFHNNLYYFKAIDLEHYALQLSLSDIRKTNIINICQSKYAYLFLKKKKIKNLYTIIDYILVRNKREHKKNRYYS